MPRLQAGDTAPNFKLPDQDGEEVSLADLRRQAGKSGSVVVYFYPADDTPGCTKEACQFN
jgi:peroxiredoxin Q/BCP